MCANTVSSRQEAKVRCQGPLGTARAQPYSLRLLICPARKEFVFFFHTINPILNVPLQSRLMFLIKHAVKMVRYYRLKQG